MLKQELWISSIFVLDIDGKIGNVRDPSQHSDLSTEITMANLIDVSFGHGTLRYFSAVDEVPATSKTTGNVTVNNMGSPGSPAYFEVSFMLSADFEEGGMTRTNIFHWNVSVLDMNIKSSYRDVESEAARKIGPMLRQLADSIEKQVAEYDARKANDNK
jgi:hypothetical protein